MLPLEEMPKPSREVFEKFRIPSHPNTYGVSEILVGPDEQKSTFGVGIEYFCSRDLPEYTF